MDEDTFDQDSLNVASRFLGRRHRFTFGNRRSDAYEYRMNVTIESAVGYHMAERNHSIDEYKWRLVVNLARPDLKRTTNNAQYYLGEREAFKTRLVFDGPGASNGRDAEAMNPEDFREWERDMLKAGSQLYLAYAEVLLKFAKVGPCMYCNAGVCHDSYVCESCLKLLHGGCACCGCPMGKLTDAGVHEVCE